MPTVQSTRLPATGFVLLASLGLFWGLNWPGMKIVLSEMTVWWFRAFSVAAGCIGLLALAKLANGTLWLRRREVGPLLLVAVFAIVGWHLFTGYGVSQMPAGRASIIAFTMPVWASLLAVPILGEAMTRAKIIGLILGISGLAVLIGPDLVVLQSAPLGAAYMLGAAVTWAIGTVLFKRFRWDSPITAIMGWQLAVGFAVLLPGAIILEPFPDIAALSTDAWLSIAYLFAVPMVYCQWAYLKVVSLFPAAIAAIGTLSVPIVGVYSSALILGEQVGWPELSAMALICAALTVVLVLPALAARKSATAIPGIERPAVKKGRRLPIGGSVSGMNRAQS